MTLNQMRLTILAIGLWACVIGAGIALAPQHAHAIDLTATERYTTINSDGSNVGDMDWNCAGAFAQGIRWLVFNDSGSISTGSPWCFGENPDKTETGQDLSSQTVDGTYEFRFRTPSTSLDNTDYYEFYRFVRTGGVWTAGSAGPEWDENGAIHVMRINEPGLYEIASSTFDVSFDVHQPSGYGYTHYWVSFTSPTPYQTFVLAGSLEDDGWNGTDENFTISTTTSLAVDGTYRMRVALGTYSGAGSFIQGVTPDWGTQDNTGHYFSVNENTFIVTTVFPGLATQEFASTSCAINFLGTFSLSECVGYLTKPSGESLSQFSGLTLAGSFPFSYAYQVEDIRNALFASPLTAETDISVETPIGEMTFLSQENMEAVPFAPLIKTLLSAVMWFMASMVIYRKVIKSHDQTSHV